eukprot:scpid25305/ scgid4057/ Niemann-Pick C1 protein
MFVIVQVWRQMSNKEHATKTVPERLGTCLQRAGVSVTVTSFTDFAAFMIGATTILPALQSFCIFAGVGVLFDFLTQITFFSACLAIDARRVDKRHDACLFCMRLPDDWKPLNIKGKWLFRYFRDYHAKYLAKLPVKIAALVITIGMAVFGAVSASQIDIHFDFFWFLPPGSYVLDYNRLSDQYFASSRVPFTMYLTSTNYPSPGVQSQLNSFINNTRNNAFVDSNVPVDTWLEGLQRWPNATNLTGSDNFYPALTSYVSDAGARFASALNISNEGGTTQMLASSFAANFISLPHTRDEISAMDSVRDLAESQTFEGGVKPFAYTRLFLPWTTNKVIDQELVRNLLLAMAAVFVVTLLLITNLLVSFYVLLCVVFTVVDTFMVMHYWDLTINTVTAVIIILSIGLGVDYSAHIGHFYISSPLKTRAERVDAALTNVGVAVFSGGFSTFLAFVLLALSDSYIFTAFFKINLAVVIFGLWHGLVFLPVTLSLIGPSASHAVSALPEDKKDIEMEEVKGPERVPESVDGKAETSAWEKPTANGTETYGHDDDRIPEVV